MNMLFGLQYLGCRQYGLSLFRLLSPEYIPAASYRSLSLACLRNSWARDIICRRNISLREARHARRQLPRNIHPADIRNGSVHPGCFCCA